jgi:hypothetical protein
MSNEMTITQWHVPVDDVTSYWYAIFTSFGKPVNKALMRAQRLELYDLPGYVPRINKSNNYGYDPDEQASETYTGMGHDINVHDQWAVESMGAIQDRTKEHLGQSDVAITAYRRMLRLAINAMQDGRTDLPMRGNGKPVATGGPAAIDVIAPIDDWRDSWIAGDRARREQAPWGAATR